MSAETLRRAASEMRKRTINAGISPWSAEGTRVVNREVYAKCGDERTAEHIASWHPAVALAVADWMEATARELVALGDPDLSAHPQDGRRTAALAVARAYLQESP